MFDTPRSLIDGIPHLKMLKGKVSDRPYAPEEQIAIAQVIEQLGTATHDIYLKNIAY